MDRDEQGERKVIIIGAGPAGLTAAYELCQSGISSIVLEKDDFVGGLARTVTHKDFRFDIGGHRFYTKVEAASNIWRDVLPPNDFPRRKRLSRIYYNKKFFHYPLRASSMLRTLGMGNGFLILLSYLAARAFPFRRELTFEEWVTNRFGRRLYRIFFKSYTEKVWGIPCNQITAEWASQRIKGLSLAVAIKDALGLGKKEANVKTLINEFHYPRLGPGMMWERMAGIVEASGGSIRLGTQVEKLHWHRNKIVAVETKQNGRDELISGSDFISSMPMRELAQKLTPAPPPSVLDAADKLSYRDFLTVALIVNRRNVFPDNWIYIHDPSVRMGRVQNFKNWSPDMVPDENKTCLGLEYFCFEGDGLWAMSDTDLIELGTRELEILGLITRGDVAEGKVLRVPKAYPVYDSTYKEAVNTLREFFGTLTNLQLVGRNGMHKYNNQDHSMLTAMLAVKNILGADLNLWQVNTDQDYQEETNVADVESYRNLLPNLRLSQPLVPERIQASSTSSVE